MSTNDPRRPLISGEVREDAGDLFLEAKLHWPPSRADWVIRDRLLDRMRQAAQHPVTLVAAPAGYGKTIMVAQWLADEHRPAAAWVSLDSGDNDPNRLLTHVAAALSRAGCAMPVPEPARVDTARGDAGNAALPAIINAVTASPDEVVIVLDDFHFIRHPTCHAQMEFLVEHLPPQAHLVLVTRADPGLRLGRLRASGRLAEIRADELGFTAEEVDTLLAREQVALSAESVSLLLKWTEGWPAGLYLATLSLAGREDPDEFVRAFSGSNRFVGDYLTEEVLSRHPDQVRDFITTVSILDRFSASLCDHVAGTTTSAALLHDLERNNLFLVPLDADRHWFRFHHLFAAVARSELEITHPERLPSLHSRAADWFRAHGHVDEAVQHSLAAGETEAASLLVQQNWLTYVDAGRVTTVLGWLESIETPSVESDPAARVTSAWLAALIGDETALAGYLEGLDELTDHGPLPDGSRSVESAIAMIHGLFGYGGPVEMMEGAQRAVALETDTHSPFHAIAQVVLGHAAYVAGDLDRASAPLAVASRSDRAPRIVRALSLSTESLVEFERGDLERSRECAEQAMDVVETKGLRALPQVSLAYTALGLAQAAAGKTEDALDTLERGLELRRETTAHGPWGMIHHLLVTARVAALAGSLPMARELLSELAPRMARYTDGMAAMNARVVDVRHLIRDADQPIEAFSEPLTSREVDILRLLQGSMSLQQIAGELYLSFNTVKTHTRAVYRKLGVHTRAEAVRVGRQQALI